MRQQPIEAEFAGFINAIEPPQPPEKPLPGDCCGGGCLHCVFELYDDALERYQEALVLWKSQCRQ